MRLLRRLYYWLIRRHNPQPTRFDVHFRSFGFPVRVHPTFWLCHATFAAAIATADFLRGDPWWALAFVLCLAGTTVSVLTHELGHALTGRRFGSCGEIVLVGLGGFAHLTYYGHILNMGYRPSRRGRVLILLAGPAVNLAATAVMLAVWALTGSAREIYREIVNNSNVIPQSLVGCPLHEFLVLVLVCVNLAASVGNLIPIPPNDGWWIALEVIGWIRTRGRPNWDTDDPEWWSRVR